MAAEREIQPQIDQNRLLIGASSYWAQDAQGNYFESFDYAKSEVIPHIAGRENVVIIPYASGKRSASPDSVKELYKSWGAKSVYNLYDHPEDEIRIIEQGEAFHGTGGNTITLNQKMREGDGEMADTIRRKIADRIPWVGVSAGLLAMTEEIGYAADPETSSHRRNPNGTVITKGLSLLPSHIRLMPHLAEKDLEETVYRNIEENPENIVLGLHDYSLLVVEGHHMHTAGQAEVVLFEQGKAPQIFEPGSDISNLLVPRQQTFLYS
jgi:peptidase E